MKSERVRGYRSLRCGHLTVPHTLGPPRRCGKCKSPDWDRPRMQRFEQAKK